MKSQQLVHIKDMRSFFSRHVLQSVSKTLCEEDIVLFTCLARTCTRTRTHGWTTVNHRRTWPAGQQRRRTDATHAHWGRSLLKLRGDVTSERPTPANQTVESSACRLLAAFSPRCFTTFLRSMMDSRTLRTKGLFTATR